MRCLLSLLLLWLLAAPAAQAQYFAFGKNKVQYERPDWRFVRTDHFDVYYYGDGYPVAAFAARAAEAAYADVRRLTGHTLERRVPVLLYAGGRAFAATTAVDLPTEAEGIGGVTELLKNRVVLPFTGDYADLRHVLHHEIVHAVLNDLLYGGTLQALVQSGLRARLPLWMGEGLAEYSAHTPTAEADAYLREAVVSGTLPPVSELDGFAAYWGGQAFFDYVAAEYGEAKITELIGHVASTGDVDAAFRRAVGLDVAGVSERWHRALRAVYFPDVAARVPARVAGQPLVPPGTFASAPALSPMGDRLAYVGSEGGFWGVYVVETRRGAQPRRVVAGQRSTAFESLRLLSPGLSWSGDGTRVAVAVTSGADEAVAVVDVATGRARLHRLPGVAQVTALAWHPTRETVAVAAATPRQADLLLLHLPRGKAPARIDRLTDDLRAEHAPAWTPDGDALLFYAADAPLDTLALRRPAHRLFRLPVSPDGAASAPPAQPIATPQAHDPAHPHAVRDAQGRTHVAYLSDHTGVSNLYALAPDGTARALTNLLEGATQLTTTPDGRHAAFASLDGGRPSLYLLRDLLTRDADPPPTVRAVQTAPGLDSLGVPPALRVASPALRAANPFLRAALPLPPAPAAADTADGTYGRVRVELEAPEPIDRASAEPDASASALDVGPLAPRPYRLTFSTDLVYATSQVNTLYGLQGTAQIRFSDLTGAYRFYGGSNLLLDLRNSDYVVGLESVGGRDDWSVSGAHVSRVLETDTLGRNLARYRLYSASASRSRPLDRFRRVEARVALLGVSEANLFDPAEPTVSRLLLYPSLTYTYDASEPGAWGLRSGMRAAVSLAGTPLTLSGDPARFATLLADARGYLTPGPYTLALRLSGAASGGTDPQRFYASGVQGWLNPDLAQRRLPTTGLSGFAFATPVLPLRGHPVGAASGPLFALVNAEVRVPLVRALRLGPLPPLYGLRAAAFVDAAAVWGDGANRTLSFRADADGQRPFGDALVGVGGALRGYLVGLPLSAALAWPLDGSALGRPSILFSLHTEF